MNIILKKNKMPTVSVDEYMSSISNKVDKNITISNKSFKINDNDIIIDVNPLTHKEVLELHI